MRPFLPACVGPGFPRGQSRCYSLVGMFVMLTAYAILTIAANTFGLGDRLDCANDPSGAGCDFIFMPNTGVGGGTSGGIGSGN